MFNDYRDNLSFIHKNFNPNTYLEIGVETGRSLMLANEDCLSIGVDPRPVLFFPLTNNTQVFNLTSDNFFETEINKVLENKKIDFAFIDGMHNFEYALRDFINTEKHANPNSIIAIHDILPMDELTSRRIRETGFWTGDVYKLVLILKEYRPDLKIYNSDIPPAGLAIVTNLDPNSTILQDNYDEIYEKYINYDFANIETNKRELLLIKDDNGYQNFLENIPTFK